MSLESLPCEADLELDNQASWKRIVQSLFDDDGATELIFYW